jgi:hypothetical protein
MSYLPIASSSADKENSLTISNQYKQQKMLSNLKSNKNNNKERVPLFESPQPVIIVNPAMEKLMVPMKISTDLSSEEPFYHSYQQSAHAATKSLLSSMVEGNNKPEYMPVEINDPEELVEVQKLEEELVHHNEKNFRFSAFIGVNILFLLLVSAMVYYTRLADENAWAKNFGHKTADSFSIEVDAITNRYFVIDNNPLPNFPFANPVISNDLGTNNNRVILADGLYSPNLAGDGWNYISVETMDLKSFALRLNETKGSYLPESEQLATIRDQYVRNMKALGYLEGYMSCNEIKQYYENFYAGTFTNRNLTQEAVDFLLLNYQWMERQSEQFYSSSNYWLVVKGVLSQMNGMILGARDGCASLTNLDGPKNQKFTDGVQYADTYHDDGSKTGGSVHNGNRFQSIFTLSDFENPDMHYQDVFLPSMHKKPELIHFLLVNANGDLFQIKQKFDIADRFPTSANNDDIDRRDDDDDKIEEDTITNTTPPPITPIIVTGNNTHTTPVAAPEDTEDQTDDVTDDEDKKLADNSVPAADATAQPLVARHLIRRRLEEVNNIILENNNNMESSSSGQNKNLRKGDAEMRRKLLKQKNELAAKIQRILTTNNRKKKAPVEKNRKFDHCSAIIKILPNNSDIVFGHNTWDDFTNAAPRIFKHYTYTLLQG